MADGVYFRELPAIYFVFIVEAYTLAKHGKKEGRYRDVRKESLRAESQTPKLFKTWQSL